MKKCPVCGKNHKYQHTAQQCFQDYMMAFDTQNVSGNKLSDFEIKAKCNMKKYYFNLPINLKFNNLIEEK